MSGARDTKIQIMRPSEDGRNEHNEPQKSLVALCSVWAARRNLSQVEAVSAGHDAAARVAEFTVRSNAKIRTVTTDDIVAIGAERWNIKSALPDHGARARHVVIRAVRGGNV